MAFITNTSSYPVSVMNLEGSTFTIPANGGTLLINNTDIQSATLTPLVANGEVNCIYWINTEGDYDNVLASLIAGPGWNQYKGTWSSTWVYVVNDVVNFSGYTYMCLVGNTNQSPPTSPGNTTYWQLVGNTGIVNSAAVVSSNGVLAATSAAQAAASAAQAEAAASLASVTGTSTTSLTPGSGTISLTTQTNMLFSYPQYVIISSAANSTNYMFGQVASYQPTSGLLTVNVSIYGGSGTHTDWKIALSGLAGTSWNWAGAWNSTTAYTSFTGVSYNGSSWLCIANNTNQPPVAGTYWSPMTLGIDNRGNWATATAYNINDIVKDFTGTGNIYQCVVAHTSGTLSVDISNGNWYLLVNNASAAASAAAAAASATAAALSASGTTYNGTSTTSVTIGTGSISFTTQTGLQFSAPQWVIIASTANNANYMTGNVTSYNSSTGVLIVNVVSNGGSGTYGSWQISLAGVPGAGWNQWKGTWSNATSYHLNDEVALNGSSYICISPNTNQVPPNATYWNVVAQAGIAVGAGNFAGQVTYTGSQTLSAAQTGYLITFTGTSPATFTLPLISTMTGGENMIIQNLTPYALTLQCAGSDTTVIGITSLTLSRYDEIIITAQSTSSVWTAAGGSAALPYSSVFAGPNWTTPAQFDNTTRLATTQYVNAAGLQFPVGHGIFFTTATSLSLSQLGGWGEFQANVTVTLPPIASAMLGVAFTFQGGSTGGTIAGNGGTDEIYNASGSSATSLAIAAGETITIVNNGSATGWYVVFDGLSAPVVNTAVNGGQSISCTAGGTITLTATQAVAQIMIFTGTLPSNTIIVVPTAFKTFVVENSTTGAYTLTVKTASGSGVIVNQGKTQELICDGTNVVISSTDLIGSGICPITIWNTISTATTAVAYVGYQINTSTASVTLTLPANPLPNQWIDIGDYAGTFSTNNLIIGYNGNNIMGLAQSMTVGVSNITFRLTYIDATQGWKIT